jgi:hypothetical protein
MDDLSVDRGAQRRGEPVVALERGRGACVADDRLCQPVEFTGGDSRRYRFTDTPKCYGRDTARLAHDREFIG